MPGDQASPEPQHARNTVTIEWHYTAHDNLGVLSVTGCLGAQAADRFVGAIDCTAHRGTGPVIVDLTELKGWSVAGQGAIVQVALHLTAHDRSLELAAIPADGSLVPDATQLSIPVHANLDAALTAHRTAPRLVRWTRRDGTAGPAKKPVAPRSAGRQEQQQYHPTMSSWAAYPSIPGAAVRSRRGGEHRGSPWR